ncbi:peroxiredoxin [Corallococcus sp. AB004]|uniref:peroxiredoxin family protein n=1 Tax=Corallococcus TaxID=83461 RepID=UPI000EA0E3EE|nr:MULTISPECIES: redoxin domain-containing protein [Corallococcus]NPC71321.1 redoxin domain-containing protein [Corallococcus exiguus]NPD25787.1 redoxin domain-containing protein [Corallococcus exiguus]RKH95385.1 peroxiredoxin [Corallococcus sp. AB038B]RKI42670.1 peroxiredoxin [Corallococcus sp. AB004]
MLNSLLVVGWLSAAIPQVGDTAPDFTVKDTAGTTHTLSEMVKKGPVIVAFFPKAFTGGCTKELTAYRDRYKDIEQAQGQVLAFSTDDAETLTRFKTELKAPFLFIPDPDGKVVGAYDVKMPVLTVSKRYTFVVGEDRKVLNVSEGKDAIDVSGAIAACPLRKGGAAKPAAAPAGTTPPTQAAPATK